MKTLIDPAKEEIQKLKDEEYDRGCERYDVECDREMTMDMHEEESRDPCPPSPEMGYRY